MDFTDPRIRLLLAGGAVALVAGVGIASVMMRGAGHEPAQASPASNAGLVIDSAGADDDRMDPAKPLRCFVAGQYVGELTLALCAQRNGVATDALDVGLDETGALAAAQQVGPALAPLPPAATAPTAPDTSSDVASAEPVLESAQAGACWRYDQGKWTRQPAEVTLGACVQSLFAGRCERIGAASYGRWAQQTLRLVPGRVEISPDNRSFRPLVEQGPGCSIAPRA